MMNPHYPHYAELSSPSSPVDNNNYPNGSTMLNNGAISGPQSTDPQQRPAINSGVLNNGPLNNSGAMNNSNSGLNNGGMNSGMSTVMNSPAMNSPGINGHPGTGSKTCAGCSGKILERFLLHALDRYWHHTCLKCSCCGAMLADIGSSCFTRGGMILCKEDYLRIFGNSGACSSCGQMIPANEFVMRAGQGSVYHLKCFTCYKCQTQLVPGDRYSVINGSLICEQDCQKMHGAKSLGTTGVRKGKVGRPRRTRE